MEHTQDHPYRRRLAAPAGSDDAEDLTGFDLERDVLNDIVLAEALADPGGVYHELLWDFSNDGAVRFMSRYDQTERGARR